MGSGPDRQLHDDLAALRVGLHPQFRPLPVVLRAGLYQVVVHVRKDSIVHLQQQSRLVNRLILLAKRICQSVNVLALAAVVFVQPVERRGRTRLPTCVVRMRLALRFIGESLLFACIVRS